MPMVGVATSLVMRVATSRGIPSSTMRGNSGLVERDGVTQQPVDGLCGLALHLVAAHAMHRLRRQADVSDDRNLRVDNAADEGNAPGAALDLHRLGTTFLDEARGVLQRLAAARVIGAEGHVGHQKCVPHGAAHGASVVQHLVHGDRKSAVIAEHHLGERVSDQDHVYAGFIGKARGGVIVGGERNDGLVVALFFRESVYGNALAEIASSDAHDSSSVAPPGGCRLCAEARVADGINRGDCSRSERTKATFGESLNGTPLWPNHTQTGNSDCAIIDYSANPLQP